jgi:hypothetical protein
LKVDYFLKNWAGNHTWMYSLKDYSKIRAELRFIVKVFQAVFSFPLFMGSLIVIPIVRLLYHLVSQIRKFGQLLNDLLPELNQKRLEEELNNECTSLV